MRMLLVDDNVKADLKVLAEHAEKNPFSLQDLQNIMEKITAIPGNRKEFIRMVPDGYKVVFTINQGEDYRMRHLSVSVPEPGKLPSMHAVEEIMSLLGFNGKTVLDVYNVSVEEFDPGHYAVNIMELIV